MAKLSYLKGVTSVTVNVFIQDSTSTTGGGKTGLAYNTASLTAYYAREKAASAAITLATQTTTGAWSSGGFVEIDATNMPGMYRLDIPDAVLATGSNSAQIMLKGATGMAPLVLEIELEGVDRRDATGFGLSRLDAAITTRLAPTTAGRTLDVSAGGEAGVDWANIGSPTTTVNLSGTTVKTATDVEADTQDIQTRLPAALISGRIDASVGAMEANVITAAATAADFTTEVTAGLSTLDAAGVRTAVGMASANLDTQIGTLATQALLTTVAGYLDTEIAAIKAKTDNLPSDPADASDIAASFASIASTLSTISGYLDTEVAAILAAVDTEVGAIKAKTDNLPGSPAAAGDQMALTSAAVDAILDEVVEGSVTLRQMVRGFAAALLGKASGLATATAVYRDTGDTKDRITATVDADGNRSAVTLDLS